MAKAGNGQGLVSCMASLLFAALRLQCHPRSPFAAAPEAGGQDHAGQQSERQRREAKEGGFQPEGHGGTFPLPEAAATARKSALGALASAWLPLLACRLPWGVAASTAGGGASTCLARASARPWRVRPEGLARPWVQHADQGRAAAEPWCNRATRRTGHWGASFFPPPSSPSPRSATRPSCWPSCWPRAFGRRCRSCSASCWPRWQTTPLRRWRG